MGFAGVWDEKQLGMAEVPGGMQVLSQEKPLRQRRWLFRLPSPLLDPRHDCRGTDIGRLADLKQGAERRDLLPVLKHGDVGAV